MYGTGLGNNCDDKNEASLTIFVLCSFNFDLPEEDVTAARIDLPCIHIVAYLHS